ncbi:MAG: YtxH protein [Sphingobacteriales bacterium]|nr:YtxH protein [Sphingobacteriales bacterium]
MKNLKNLVNDAESGVKDIQDSVKATFSENELVKVLGVALIGVAVGAIIGILFAPNRGEETRRTIGDSMKDLGNTVADKAKQGTSRLSELKDQAVDTVKSKIGGTNTSEPSFANTGRRETSFNE